MEVEISSINLTSFQYIGLTTNLRFVGAVSIEKVHLWFLSSFPIVFFTIQVLPVPANMTEFSHLKELELVLILSSDFDLLSVASILNVSPCLLKFHSSDSYKGGVVVQVTRWLSVKDNVKRKFTQSFFLAPQDKGYFVLNDIFRYVDEYETVESDAVSIAVNGVTEVSTVEVEVVEAPVHSGQDEVLPITEPASTVLEDTPKKSYASIVKVMKETTPVHVPTNVRKVAAAFECGGGAIYITLKLIYKYRSKKTDRLRNRHNAFRVGPSFAECLVGSFEEIANDFNTA
ncbi:hypothetical protein IFM89_013817 [Coptis chinensis]|uniref:NTF2 domain-containing protein n=1 Tax=Coptis chinensis TaxID=261450 RepID=A0A835LMX8_9MAGN|nr:hypothetical protein IFM89_013817 [Coptis chinensis]